VNKIVLVAASTLASIALVGCGSNDSESASSTDTTTTETTTTTTETTTTTTTTTDAEKPTEVKVVVVNGAPQGGIVRASVNKDDQVVLVVTSDVADEIHLHGYDKAKDVAAGGTIRIPFKATIPGRFEAELESRGVQIAEISVEP
jgi:ABC-type glycerol-3-phosphate transport system substrate-binding protein